MLLDINIGGDMNINTVLVLIILFVLFFLAYNCNYNNKEKFTSFHIPDMYNYKMCNKQLQSCKHHLVGRTGDLRKQLYNCKNELAMRKKGPRPYKPYLENCLNKLDKQKRTSTYYYKKFRELENKLSYTSNELNYTQDALRECNKKLGFCKRYRTMKPTYVGKVDVYQDYYPAMDSITGTGLGGNNFTGLTY